MKTLTITTELAAAGETRYVPVPCRGNVHSVRIASDLQIDAAGTVLVARAGDTVNLVTVPGGNVAAGIILDGVPDTTNKALIFDPDSSTATDKVLKITSDVGFLAGAATVGIVIEYDDSAYVEQAASEA